MVTAISISLPSPFPSCKFFSATAKVGLPLLSTFRRAVSRRLVQPWLQTSTETVLPTLLSPTPAPIQQQLSCLVTVTVGSLFPRHILLPLNQAFTAHP